MVKGVVACYVSNPHVLERNGKPGRVLTNKREVGELGKVFPGLREMVAVGRTKHNNG